MKRFRLLLLVALSPPAIAAADKKPAAFASKEGKFSVALPDKPTEKTSKIDVGDRKIDLHVFTVAQKDRAYVVTYNDFAKETIGADKEKFVAGVVERNIGNLKGSKVIS